MQLIDMNFAHMFISIVNPLNTVMPDRNKD